MSVLKNIFYYMKYGYKSDSNLYIKYLRKKGIRIGDNTRFFSPWTINVDVQRPWMITIGSNVKITSGVKILQHGYDWAVLKGKYGIVFGSSGKVDIGNNIFIGVNTTILSGVKITDNVIIGANSLVCKNIDKEGVYAGCPAKFIMSLSDYKNKRASLQNSELEELTLEYYKLYNKMPKKELLKEYMWLFEKRDNFYDKDVHHLLNIQNNYDKSYSEFVNSSPIYNGYDDFISHIYDIINNSNK